MLPMNNVIFEMHHFSTMKVFFLGIILFCLPTISWSQDSALKNYIENLNQLAQTIHIKKLDSLIAVFRFTDKETFRMLIKKARYRLRKKMALDSGEDLQGIVLSI